MTMATAIKYLMLLQLMMIMSEAQTELRLRQDPSEICPGEPVIYTCTANMTSTLRWNVTSMAGVMSDVSFDRNSGPGVTMPVGDFTANLTNRDDIDPQVANFTSTLNTTATDAINATIIECIVPFLSAEQVQVIVLAQDAAVCSSLTTTKAMSLATSVLIGAVIGVVCY